MKGLNALSDFNQSQIKKTNITLGGRCTTKESIIDEVDGFQH